MFQDKISIKEKLHSIILDIIEEDDIPISDDLSLINDYGLDSMGFLGLSVQIQRSFSVTISSEEWPSIKTLNELANVVWNKINNIADNGK